MSPEKFLQRHEDASDLTGNHNVQSVINVISYGRCRESCCSNTIVNLIVDYFTFIGRPFYDYSTLCGVSNLARALMVPSIASVSSVQRYASMISLRVKTGTVSMRLMSAIMYPTVRTRQTNTKTAVSITQHGPPLIG